jgi:hypothetical protein
VSFETLSPWRELEVLVTTLLVLAIPGWALLSLRGSWRRYATLQAWAIALSLGVAFYPVLYASAGAIAPALALRRGALLALLAALALLTVWNLRRDLLAPWRFVRLEQIALVVIALTLATRAWVAHVEPFPAWSDSLHHVLLTQLTAEAGRLPATMAPYFPIPLARYHLGLYALTATVQSLAGVPPHAALLWTAQVLSGLCGLGVYLVIDRSVGRVPAVIGAICAGLLSHQPAFYVNWGRFTQLAAQTILLPAWLLTWDVLHDVGGDHRADARPDRALPGAFASLLIAGVFLLHLRVAFFLALLLALTFAAELWRARHVPRGARSLLLVAGALVAASLAIAGPRLLHTVAEYAAGEWAALRYAGLDASGTAAGLGDPEYFAFSRASVAYLFADDRTLAAILALAAIALARCNLVAWLMGFWAAGLLTVASVPWLRLPPLNLTNLGAVLIMLYLPASLLVAAGIGELLAWSRAGAGVRTAVLLAFLVLGGIAARDRVSQLEPERFFVTAADLRALQWLDDYAPGDAMIAVRTRFWLPNAPHGIDAGYWIPYLIKRRTTVGPMISNLAPQYANWAIEMSRRVQKVSDDDSQLVWLWGRGVRFVYLGALADPAEAVRLAASPHVALRYADGGVFIFEVDPSGGTDERPAP